MDWPLRRVKVSCCDHEKMSDERIGSFRIYFAFG